MILNQKNKNIKCVYTAIGQKNSTVMSIFQELKNNEAMKYTTIVNASASDSPSMQYIAPYSAMSIAEEWLKKGDNVLIIFDDLSKHAIAYRTLSLLLKRPVGREAYPGDVFYLHSRLLERACKLNEENGGGSITAIPIIETEGGDITNYIPTNVISITDGQIFLITDLFNNDIKPAIDIDFSVSRIGSSAQFPMMKQTSKKIKAFLANYHKLKEFSKFGGSLINDEKTKNIITRGNVLTEYFKQQTHEITATLKQCISLFIINSGLLDFTNGYKVNETLDNFFVFLNKNKLQILNVLDEKKELNKFVEDTITETFKEFLTTKI